MVEICLSDRLIGRRYGSLVVEAMTAEVDRRGLRMLKCRCDCGADRLCAKNDLKQGKLKTCGCGINAKWANLAGKRFGRLSVLRKGPTNKHNQNTWVCKCACGRKTTVIASSLTKENGTRSCGCISGDRASAAARLRNMNAAGLARSERFQDLIETMKRYPWSDIKLIEQQTQLSRCQATIYLKILIEGDVVARKKVFGKRNWKFIYSLIE